VNEKILTFPIIDLKRLKRLKGVVFPHLSVFASCWSSIGSTTHPFRENWYRRTAIAGSPSHWIPPVWSPSARSHARSLRRDRCQPHKPRIMILHEWRF